MRIDYQENTRKSTGRAGKAGLNAMTAWTLMGAALTAACAHDGSSYLVDGGGGTGEAAAGAGAASTAARAALAFIAAVGVTISAGDGGGGGGDADRPHPAYSWELEDTEESHATETFGHDDLSSRGGQDVERRFVHDFPDHQDVSFRASLPDGTVSQAVSGGPPQAAPQASPQAQAQMEGMGDGSEAGGKVFHKDDFDYNRMLEGSYGTLYYNNGEGHWTYEADPRKVNPLKDGETGEEVFHVTAVASSEGAASAETSAHRALSIAIRGKDERTEPGEATWSANAPTAKVGDVLTVTLTDHDGLPTNDGERPRFELFHDDDAVWSNDGDFTNDGWTAIDPEHASTHRGGTGGVIRVAQEHVGKHFVVKITYTDLNGNPEEIVAYANPDQVGGVANHELPGGATFDPGTPMIGEGEITVRMSDGNMPASVTYLWFYSDDIQYNSPPLNQRIGDVPEPKTGDDRYHDTVPVIPNAAADKHLGVEITYNDGAGTGEDKIVAYAAGTIVGTAESTAEPEEPEAPPRNYGPSISPDRNDYDNFIVALKARHMGHETSPRTIVFGERGWQNDPQHTPNNQLLMTFESVESRNLERRAADSAGLDLKDNHANLIVDRSRSPDTHYDSNYGTWRFDRLDSHSARHETEEEGVLWWTYQLGATSAQHANVQAYLNSGFSDIRPLYDQMFIRVSDGEDHAVVRLTVEIGRHFNPFQHNLTRLKHVEDPETGAAPTLGPSNEQTIQTTATVYYESTQTWGWDNINHHNTWTREFNYGDNDTNQSDLTMVYHIRTVDSVDFATEFLTDRTFLDLPHDYLDTIPEADKATAIANGWEPGDIGRTGKNEISSSANRDPNQHSDGWTWLPARYGYFYAKRIDDHETRIAEGLDETGVLRWYYDIGGADDIYGIINSLNSNDHPNHFNVRALSDGQYGFDIVYFQIFDDDGNKSDVRSIVVPIAGKDSTIEGAINKQWYPHRAWLDSYDNIYENNFDVPASYEPPADDSSSTSADII